MSIFFFFPYLGLYFLDGGEVFDEREFNEVLPWRTTRRSMAEGNATANNTSLILAQGRTNRKDPLDNFKRYTGGWNISNRHYIAVKFPSNFFNNHLSLTTSKSVLFFFFFEFLNRIKLE